MQSVATLMYCTDFYSLYVSSGNFVSVCKHGWGSMVCMQEVELSPQKCLMTIERSDSQPFWQTSITAHRRHKLSSHLNRREVGKLNETLPSPAVLVVFGVEMVRQKDVDASKRLFVAPDVDSGGGEELRWRGTIDAIM